MSEQFDVVVIGSLNHDISVLAPRLPHPGETIIATGHFSGSGGKGANQAVAAARLGASVAMIGRVGDDEHGNSLVQGLIEEGVDVASVGVDDELGTGLALITIDPDGENTIVGSSGANMGLTPELVRESEGRISTASVVVAQLEVSIDCVAKAASITEGLFLLNPAPAHPLPRELLARVDVLVPNRSELGVLAGCDEPKTAIELAGALERLEFGGPVVVTLGAHGALLSEGGRNSLYPAVPVAAVDATGAGDAFCGALAFALSRGWDMETGVPFAVAAASVAVTRLGAQASMPTRDEVEVVLRR